jgi:hypothetical protein
MNQRLAMRQQRLDAMVAATAAPDAVVDAKTAARQQALMRAMAAAQTRVPTVFKRGKGAIK